MARNLWDVLISKAEAELAVLGGADVGAATEAMKRMCSDWLALLPTLPQEEPHSSTGHKALGGKPAKATPLQRTTALRGLSSSDHTDRMFSLLAGRVRVLLSLAIDADPSALANADPSALARDSKLAADRAQVYQAALDALLVLVQVKIVACELSGSALRDVLSMLLHALAQQERVRQLPEGATILTAVESITCSLLRNADRSRCYDALLLLLLRPPLHLLGAAPSTTASAAAPHRSSSSAAEGQQQQWTQLVVKCLVKISNDTFIRSKASSASPGAAAALLDVPGLLWRVQAALVAMGTEDGTAAAGSGRRSDDRPAARLLRAIVLELCRLRKRQILQDAFLLLPPQDGAPGAISGGASNDHSDNMQQCSVMDMLHVNLEALGLVDDSTRPSGNLPPHTSAGNGSGGGAASADPPRAAAGEHAAPTTAAAAAPDQLAAAPAAAAASTTAPGSAAAMTTGSGAAGDAEPCQREANSSRSGSTQLPVAAQTRLRELVSLVCITPDTHRLKPLYAQLYRFQAEHPAFDVMSAFGSASSAFKSYVRNEMLSAALGSLAAASATLIFSTVWSADQPAAAAVAAAPAFFTTVVGTAHGRGLSGGMQRLQRWDLTTRKRIIRAAAARARAGARAAAEPPHADASIGSTSPVDGCSGAGRRPAAAFGAVLPRVRLMLSPAVALLQPLHFEPLSAAPSAAEAVAPQPAPPAAEESSSRPNAAASSLASPSHAAASAGERDGSLIVPLPPSLGALDAALVLRSDTSLITGVGMVGAAAAAGSSATAGGASHFLLSLFGSNTAFPGRPASPSAARTAAQTGGRPASGSRRNSAGLATPSGQQAQSSGLPSTRASPAVQHPVQAAASGSGATTAATAASAATGSTPAPAAAARQKQKQEQQEAAASKKSQPQEASKVNSSSPKKQQQQAKAAGSKRSGSSGKQKQHSQANNVQGGSAHKPAEELSPINEAAVKAAAAWLQRRLAAAESESAWQESEAHQQLAAANKQLEEVNATCEKLKKDLEGSDGGICDICYDQPKTVALLHGNSAHRFCASCASRLPNRSLCPLCRKPVEKHIKLH